MDPTAKATLKGRITQLAALNSGFKSMLNVPPPPVIGGVPPVPILIQPALTPLTAALKTHADTVDQILKVLDDIVAKA